MPRAMALRGPCHLLVASLPAANSMGNLQSHRAMICGARAAEELAATPAVRGASMDDMNHHYRLLYFNVRGIVEPTRLLLALSGADWSDVRYPMGVARAGFSTDKRFQQDQDRGVFSSNMDRLPILQVWTKDFHGTNDTTTLVATIGHSHAIARFVAARHGLFGGDIFERALIDAVYECVRDVKEQWFRNVKSAGGDEAARLKARARWFGEELPALCVKLERALSPAQADSQQHQHQLHQMSAWCVGARPSLADVAVYHLLSTPVSVMSGATASFFDGESDKVRACFEGTCPRLRDVVSAVASLPAIKDWEARRPDTFT